MPVADKRAREMSTDANILQDYVWEGDFAEANHVSQRTVKRARDEPDGLAWIEWGGRVYIHLPSARQYLARRTRRPNPTRGSRRKEAVA